MLSAAIYCYAYSQEIVQTSLADAYFWLHVEYLGSPWIPALWVLLARKHHGLRGHLWILLIIPLITLVAQWTNSYHGLYDRSLQMVSRPPFWVVEAHRGPIAWLYIAYLYAALLYGAWIYISRFRTSSRLYRKQSLLFVTSCLPPLVGYLIYLFGWSPWGLDLAPVMLVISIILGYISIFRFECFNLVPMARSLVFNSMRDAALVTDLQHRLVDFNPAARKLLPDLGETVKLGNDLTTALPEQISFQQIFSEPKRPHKIELMVGGELQNFEVRILPLCVEEHQSGWAVILANITNQVRLLHDLRRDAETDELTGVANRRCFTTAIARESSRAFSLILLDIDHFKCINDRFGHAAGDKVLATVANRISSCLRRVDLLSRYGGDEFAILLPETDSNGTFEVAERIRAAVANTAVEINDHSLHVSVSIGLTTRVSAQTTDWVHLLDEADQALYRAKANGRNQAASWKELSSPAKKAAPNPHQLRLQKRS
jgi:diguanylate cyclase (GGDEF)-like protein